MSCRAVTTRLSIPGHRRTQKLRFYCNRRERRDGGDHPDNVVGNDIFSDEDLLDLFELKIGGWFSFFTGDNKYSKES